MPSSNNDWNFKKLLDAIKCVVTIPPTQVTYTCTPRLYQNSATASLLKPSAKGNNYFILLDPRQDGSVKEGIYREFNAIMAQLPNNTIEGQRYIVKGWLTIEQARQHWKGLCDQHHRCNAWALEAAQRDAELARPRLLMMELANLHPGIMSAVPVSFDGQMQFTHPQRRVNAPAHGSVSEVSASPNLIRSPLTSPSCSSRSTSRADLDPPPYDNAESTTNGDWRLYIVGDFGVTSCNGLEHAYRSLSRYLRSGRAALVLALSEDAADQWFNPDLD
ncbi:hypothetical protein VNI00_017356 [Paramarasmius palmivorus]|uniref:Uncharacterized protein n=1 Tax=Paramarasmius palmivorus TaxID=297713 RepID=A0AAW0B7S4_9AGAR